MESLQRIPALWQEYALLDSGDGEKCERFGSIIVRRPDPEALWPKANPGDWWAKAHACFVRGDSEEEGQWHVQKQVPETWQVARGSLHFVLHRASFKHVGLFPEQASNWDWLAEEVPKGGKVLNLFGYTGGASLAAAAAGAQVVHVDASKPSMGWARENATASGLSEAPIRWIVEDACQHAKPALRRGADGERDTIFLLGRDFVAQQIIGIVKTPLSTLMRSANA